MHAERSSRYRWMFRIGMGVLILLGGYTVARATDYPHSPDRLIQCASCHRIKGAPGTRLTVVGGIVNLCKLCHTANGMAEQFALDYGDQAVPGSSGTSHGFEVTADRPGYGASPPADWNMGRNLENGNVVCTTCHNVHNHRRGFPFLWITRDQICQQCHSARWNDTAPYTSHPVGVAIPNTADYQNPPHLELINGQVSCLTCHGVHYTYSLEQYRGVAEDGTTTCLTDTDANWTDGALVGWELKVLNTAGSDMKKWYQRRIITSNTAQTVCWTDPLPAAITPGDPYVLKARGTGDGYLLNQRATQLCGQCHVIPATGSHFTSANSRWPGGQYGTTYAITDATGAELWPPARSGGVTQQAVPNAFVGTCFNCHWPHGWPDGNGSVYPRLTVEHEEKLCYTCHDADPASTDVVTHFENTRWVAQGAGQWNNPNLNTRHDVNDADQTRSGARIECTHCHDPHRVSADNPPMSRLVADPDPTDGRVPTPGQSWSGSDFQSEWCLDCHDGSFPPDVTPPTNTLMNILDAYTGGGDYGPDKHGTKGLRSADEGTLKLKNGYGWNEGDILPCTACHDPSHRSTNLFQLRTVVMSEDGTTPVPTDPGCDPNYAVIDNNSMDKNINGWCWCNTCHTGSMGSNKRNCFQSGCHHHGGKF